MQPIRLKLENFGPYENSLIDFSDFYAQSLFLITGKTGAGKTTIFDGMTFALYGSTSGGLRQGREMRSNFAKTGDKTRVTFTFKQENKTYEVVREPEQLVKKLRGEGVREQAASVVLTVFDENLEEIDQLTKQKDVGIFLSDLIQLNESQFSQIVMLPQGEFRRFLNADSDSKEKVLRKLFNTYFYQDIAEFLRQKKKTQEASLKELKQELTLLVSQLEWQEEFIKGHKEDMYYQDLLEDYQKQETQYEEKEKKLLYQLNGLEEKISKQSIAIQKETKWLESFKEREIAYEKMTELESQKKAITEKKRQVEQLKKIEKIQGNYQRMVELKTDYQSALIDEQSLTNQEAMYHLELKKYQEKLTDKISSEDKIKQEKQALIEIDSMLPLFEKKAQIEEEKKQVKAQLNLKKEQEKKKKKQYEKTQLEITGIEKQLSQKTLLIEKKFELLKQKEIMNHQFERVLTFEQEKQQLNNLLEEITTSTEKLSEYQELEKNYQCEQKKAKSNWAKAQIAKLSLELIDGEACPVCGSFDHPAPTHGEKITREEMLLLESELEEIEQRVANNREAMAKLLQVIDFKEIEKSNYENLLENLRIEINEFFKEDVIKDEKWLQTIEKSNDELLEKLRLVEKNLADIETVASKLPQLNQENIANQSSLEKLNDDIRLLENQLLALNVTYQELQERLPEKWQTHQEMVTEKEKLTINVLSWEEAVAQLQEKIAGLEEQLLIAVTTLKGTKKQKELLIEKKEKEQNILSQFLLEELLTREQLDDLIKKLSDLPEKEKNIQLFEKQSYALKEDVKKLDELLKNREKPDIEPMLAIQTELQSEEKKQRELITSLQYVMKQNKKIVTSAKEKEEAMKDKLDSLEELTELANVMTGDGPNKLSMERFVLQTYLKRILQRANEKLVLLTNGRYQFELRKEQGSFKKKTGLEINIFDDNVGSLRGVNTLSGGESFIAALSLALSLAEVIQEESGGIKIDAMFIDEGFGSLDEDALEMAIRSLEAIEGDGRLIGIISHVRELKERIPQQLQIKTTIDGKSYVNERLEFE